MGAGKKNIPMGYLGHTLVICSNLAAENATMQHNHNALQQAHATLQLNNSSLQQTNASLLHEIDVVRVELASTRDDLGGTRCQLDSADDKIDHLHKSERDTHATISDLNQQVELLKNQLHDYEQGHSSRQRKHP